MSQPLGTPRKWTQSGGGDSNLVSYKLRYFQAKVAQLSHALAQKDSELARLHCVVAALRQECTRYKQLFKAGDSLKYWQGRRGSGTTGPSADQTGVGLHLLLYGLLRCGFLDEHPDLRRQAVQGVRKHAPGAERPGAWPPPGDG